MKITHPCQKFIKRCGYCEEMIIMKSIFAPHISMIKMNNTEKSYGLL